MKDDKEDIKAPLEPEHLYRKHGWHVDTVAMGDREAGVLQTPAFLLPLLQWARLLVPGSPRTVGLFPFFPRGCGSLPGPLPSTPAHYLSSVFPNRPILTSPLSIFQP